MFNVCGRRGRIVTGTRSQTVNVCTKAGAAGEYDYILRIRPPSATIIGELSSRCFSSIEQFVAYVLEHYRGKLEKSPDSSPLRQQTAVSTLRRSAGGGAGRQVIASPIPLSPWATAARDATERAIDELVLEFIKHPYRHRVEHSIQCRLFQLLASQPELQADLSFEWWRTQPIHKEWPEYVARPEKGSRGWFDLVVLSPETVRGASLDEFRGGTIRPSIVIELGLDYGYDHLAHDIRKLKNSGICDSYLIHFVRQDVGDDFGAIERLLLGCGFKSAFVRHMGSRVRYKLVGEARFHDVDVSREPS